MAKRMIGVLGGMGPLATVDFMRKVIEATPATIDQDHIPMAVYSMPQIPDRTAAILRGAESPLPAMQEGIRRLEEMGAGCIAIACNTAHYWYDEMRRGCRAELLHIGDAVADRLAATGMVSGTVGLIATDATAKTRIYQDRLAARGYDCLAMSQEDTDALFWPAIRKVKAGEGGAQPLLERAVDRLLDAGAARVILGCTEAPLGLAQSPRAVLDRCLDATDALAFACVAWATAEAPAMRRAV